jgi:hypothetical protein
MSTRDAGYQFEIQYIDMVILDIDMGYGLMIWEMTVSIRSSSISIWDILSSLWPVRPRLELHTGQRDALERHDPIVAAQDEFESKF